MSSASSSIVGYVNTVQGVLAKAIAEQRKELTDRIERLAGPPSDELVERVRVAVQARVVEEVTARLDRELRLMENVLAMKMRDATARIVDSLLEGRMAEMEDAIENKVNEVVDVKLALVRSPDVRTSAPVQKFVQRDPEPEAEAAEESATEDDVPRQLSTEPACYKPKVDVRPADFTFVPKRRAGGKKGARQDSLVSTPNDASS